MERGLGRIQLRRRSHDGVMAAVRRPSAGGHRGSAVQTGACPCDREELVDTLLAGLSPVPHTFLSPNQPDYTDIEAAVPKYEYDVIKAAQMLEGLGYQKGPDGLLRDG